MLFIKNTNTNGDEKYFKTNTNDKHKYSVHPTNNTDEKRPFKPKPVMATKQNEWKPDFVEKSKF